MYRFFVRFTLMFLSLKSCLCSCKDSFHCLGIEKIENEICLTSSKNGNLLYYINRDELNTSSLCICLVTEMAPAFSDNVLNHEIVDLAKKAITIYIQNECSLLIPESVTVILSTFEKGICIELFGPFEDIFDSTHIILKNINNFYLTEEAFQNISELRKNEILEILSNETLTDDMFFGTNKKIDLGCIINTKQENISDIEKVLISESIKTFDHLGSTKSHFESLDKVNINDVNNFITKIHENTYLMGAFFGNSDNKIKEKWELISSHFTNKSHPKYFVKNFCNEQLLISSFKIPNMPSISNGSCFVSHIGDMSEKNLTLAILQSKRHLHDLTVFASKNKAPDITVSSVYVVSNNNIFLIVCASSRAMRGEELSFLLYDYITDTEPSFKIVLDNVCKISKLLNMTKEKILGVFKKEDITDYEKIIALSMLYHPEQRIVSNTCNYLKNIDNKIKAMISKDILSCKNGKILYTERT